jgi:hypothetical protein
MAGQKAKRGGGKETGNAPGGAERENLVVGTKVREVVRAAGCMASGDLLDALSERVHELLRAAIHRARENGRATVRAHDL